MQSTDSNFSRAQIEHKHLLLNIKIVIDSLFLSKKSVGGLQNLHTSIEKIFIHGIRIFKPDGNPDLWRFIEGLNWLNPSYAVSIGNITPEKTVHIPFGRIKNDKSLEWIYRCLDTRSLSQKLRWLISDYEHLSNCFEVTAFLRNEKYTYALLILLQAIEENQPNLLTQIDTFLYSLNEPQGHKRSSSHPEFSFVKTNINQEITYESQTLERTRKQRRLPPMGNKNSFLSIDYNISESSKDEQQIQTQIEQIQSKNISKLNNSLNMKRKIRINKFKDKKNSKKKVNIKFRPWQSLPNINVNVTSSSPSIRQRSKTISQPIHIPYQRIRLTAETLSLNEKRVPSFTYKQFASDSGSSGTPNLTILNSNTNSLRSSDLTPITLVKCDDIKIHLDRSARNNNLSIREEEHLRNTNELPLPTISNPRQTINESTNSPSKRSLFSYIDYEKGESSGHKSSSLFSKSAPTDFVNTFLPKSGEKLQTQQFIPSMFDDGISLPTTACGRGFFPRPKTGQSLASYLQSAQFSRTNTELDRENAHFSVSEAMISMIEQLKFTRFEKQKLKQTLENNNVKKGKQSRRIKNWDKDEMNDDKIKTNDIASPTSTISASASTTTTNTATDCTSDDYSSNCESSDNISSQSETSNELSYLKDLSVSMQSINENIEHAAYAEWGENTREALSAEGVALSLISKFSDKQLPRASDLLWLVSEQDAPQEILPLPGSWSVNPDDKYIINSFLRGTKDWAPPRAQIIFTLHPSPDRKKIMQLQNQRCAGCGMRVAPAYSNRFRYCEYIGKYHCTGCHRNQISSIPARVLQKWDFSCKAVSVFSYRLLNQIWTFPLFRVCDLNPSLFVNIKPLRIARSKRLQLKYIQDFIITCRFAEKLKTEFENLPPHYTSDLDIWAMSDFIAVKEGSFIINSLIIKSDEHCAKCELCMARGFFCERCPKKQIIFPWQPKVKRCNNCGACYHELCWIDDCLKCERLRKRQQNI